MAQANEGNIGVTSVVDDYDVIHRVLQLCTEGEAKGDVAKLREAFHADVRMFGSLAGDRFDVPIEELFKLAESEPADTGNYRSRGLSVHQTDDGAVAVAASCGVRASRPIRATSGRGASRCTRRMMLQLPWWPRRATGGRSRSSTTSSWRVSTGTGRSLASCSSTSAGSCPRVSKLVFPGSAPRRRLTLFAL